MSDKYPDIRIWKTKLYNLQHEAPIPHLVACRRLLNFRPSQYGLEYHGDISRDETERLLQNTPDGSYLIRDSTRAANSYTLVIRFDGLLKYFMLFYDPIAKHHYVGEARFDSVGLLVADGLIHFYVETRGAEVLKMISEANNYERTPFYRLRYHTFNSRTFEANLDQSFTNSLNLSTTHPGFATVSNTGLNKTQGLFDDSSSSHIESAVICIDGQQPQTIASRPTLCGHHRAYQLSKEELGLPQQLIVSPSNQTNHSEPTNLNHPQSATVSISAKKPFTTLEPNTSEFRVPDEQHIPEQFIRLQPTRAIYPSEKHTSVCTFPTTLHQLCYPLNVSSTSSGQDANVGCSTVVAPLASPSLAEWESLETSTVSSGSGSRRVTEPSLENTALPLTRNVACTSMNGSPSGHQSPIAISDGQSNGRDSEKNPLQLLQERYKLPTACFPNDNDLSDSKPHNFKLHTFRGPHWCDYCTHFIWGLVSQGYKCTDCGFQAHKRCSDRVPHDCLPDIRELKRVFGIDLTSLTKAEHKPVPTVIVRCVEEIERRGGLTAEGIYRVPGVHDRVVDTSAAFDKDSEAVNISPSRIPDVNVLTSLIKLFFRQLPVPLITYEAYPDLIEIVQDERMSESDRLESIRRILTQLPSSHFETLRFFMWHIARVAENCELNKMPITNLAIVLSPSLLSSSYSDPMSCLAGARWEHALLERLIRNIGFLLPKDTAPSIDKVSYGCRSDQIALLDDYKLPPDKPLPPLPALPNKRKLPWNRRSFDITIPVTEDNGS